MKSNLPLQVPLILLGLCIVAETALSFGLHSDQSSKKTTIPKTAKQKIFSTDVEEADKETKHTYINNSQEITSRRNIFMACGATTVSILTSLSAPNPSEAACLSGDDRPECIGIYKVPMDDRIRSYIDTPEHLEKFAPDLKWVPMTTYPTSPKVAKDELLTMEDRLQNIIVLVQKGDLNGAGVEILSIVPRITVDGRVLVSHLEKNSDTSMRALRSENAHQDLLSSLGSSDIVLGQALAGRLGSITVAQIQILEELNEAKMSLQELLRAIPDDL